MRKNKYICPRCGAAVYFLDSIIEGRCEECAKKECVEEQKRVRKEE